MVVYMVIVPKIWVTQLLPPPPPLAVGKGGKETGAVPLREPDGALKGTEDDDGAVPSGAVPVCDNGLGRGWWQ
jgi:hypothetical protein